jgi:ketosteroid isomerase-like protein
MSATPRDPALQDLADKLAIRELVARYCRAVDDADADAFAGSFAGDGVFETPLGVVTGHDALLAHGHKMTFGNVHVTTDPIIEIDGDRATHTCTLLLGRRAQDQSANEIVATGRYFDELVRTPGGWRFKSRRAVLDLSLVGMQEKRDRTG